MDKILEIFIKNPEKEYHIREISKNLKISPTTASKYLKNFEKQGLLKSIKRSNHIYYKSESDNEKFKNIKRSFNLKQIQNSGIIDHLEEKLNYPEVIILFGSFAKGENNRNSDVDLFIVSENKIEVDLTDFEKKIGHKIQLHVYSRKDIEMMKNKNKGLLNNVINGIILYGYIEVF